MSKPILSICIPTYNSSKWLEETLDSLVCQFEQKDISSQVEIVISDNDSPDDTYEIVKEYQEKYTNIHYFRNEKNLGGAVNVIKVTENAQGEYLWLLTDNDSSSRFALGYILRIIDETSFDVMLGNYRVGTPEYLKTFYEDYKGYNIFHGMTEFGDFLGQQKNMPLHDFGSNFSLYSIFFVKREYFNASRMTIDAEKLKTHFFPHSLIVFSNIEDKIIVKPNNMFTIPMGHPSSWRHSIRLYSDFREVFLAFMKKSKLTPVFRSKIKAFLRGYWLITYIMILIGPFPFIGNTLKKLMTQSTFMRNMINKILHPGI